MAETITIQEFLNDTGLNEPLAPGQVKFKTHVAEKAGNSFTIRYDWRSDLNTIKVEILPGLSGQMPDKKELSKYAVWLQTRNTTELDVSEVVNG